MKATNRNDLIFISTFQIRHMVSVLLFKQLSLFKTGTWFRFYFLNNSHFSQQAHGLCCWVGTELGAHFKSDQAPRKLQCVWLEGEFIVGRSPT